MDIQKQRGAVSGVFAAIFAVAALAVAGSAFAAGTILSNGGLGQVAGNTQSFGVAVCNGGTATVAQSVPISVTSNGQSASVPSNAPIAPGVCTYSYVNYNALNMSAGGTYSVNVTIDPSHTVISNTNNQANYSVTVPGGPVAVAPETNAQPVGFIAVIGAAFANFFAALKNLF